MEEDAPAGPEKLRPLNDEEVFPILKSTLRHPTYEGRIRGVIFQSRLFLPLTNRPSLPMGVTTLIWTGCLQA